MNLKRFFAGMFACMMIFSILPIGAFAVETDALSDPFDAGIETDISSDGMIIDDDDTEISPDGVIIDDDDTVEIPVEQHIYDLADLLTDDEKIRLEEIFEEISEIHSISIAVVTTPDVGEKTVQAFADDFYDENGLGFGNGDDGVMLLISMAERDWYVTTAGAGIQAMDDINIDIAMYDVLGFLGDGEYFTAFECFARNCGKLISEYENPETTDEDFEVVDYDDYIFDGGYSTDYYYRNRKTTGVFTILVISAAISMIVALITTGAMKRQLISIRPQYGAESYIRNGSFHVNESRDIYLYTNVIRTPIPKDDDHHSSGQSGGGVHVSSGGVSHGGHGGKF